MEGITEYILYPKNTYYGKEKPDGPTEMFECDSFMGGPDPSQMELYRRVVRVRDRAWQLLKGLEQPEGRLYMDEERNRSADFFFRPQKWQPGQKAK